MGSKDASLGLVGGKGWGLFSVIWLSCHRAGGLCLMELSENLLKEMDILGVFFLAP